MRYPTYRVRVPAGRRPAVLPGRAMVASWEAVPSGRPEEPPGDPASAHWFMQGLPAPRGAGHPAHRRDGLLQEVYNPGIAVWRGKTVMACRIGRGAVSGIWVGYLRADLSPRKHGFVEVLPYYDGESFEDPRLLVHRDRLFLTCAVARPSRTTQCIAEIGRDLRALSFRELDSPEGRDKEKNWVFFCHGGELYCIYHAGRGLHEVHGVRRRGVEPRFATENQMAWHWGEIRGGTNAVLADGRYWTFFHSQCLYGRSRRYFMGAYAFEARPPFRVTAYTPAPLYTPPEPSRCLGMHEAKYVIFPGGLLRAGDDWMVFSGYNDERVVVSRISHGRLKDLMVEAPDGMRTTQRV